jgi:23S rRNA pseudouridine1911/1915/1917 synthase
MPRESFRRFEVVVGPADGGRRLDQFLAANVPDLSRRKARVLLDLGGVFVDGARTKVAGRLLRPGQVVVANVGGALERATPVVGKAARAGDEAALPRHTIVHRDDDLVVIDKPAGLLTAPTPESDRANLASVLRGEPGGEVFVVHRIDLETSGLLVFARTADANRALAERFRDHDVERVYLAVLLGVFGEDQRTVDLPVAGRRAVTHLAVAERLPGATLVRCTLETGRTHQIRLHARHLGHPVLGDRQHGEPSAIDPPRMALHAAVLGFPHPRTGAPLRFESPWPEDLAPWLERLRRR